MSKHKPGGCPSKRFTEAQAELAEKISNDIAEKIDCLESRNVLRMAISYFADMARVEQQRRLALESKVRIFESAKQLMDIALEDSDEQLIAKKKPSRGRQSTGDQEKHRLWSGQLYATEELPWYYEDDAGGQGFCCREPRSPGFRYRREWPNVGPWVQVPPLSAIETH